MYILAFILPIVALAAIGFRSTIGLASKPAHWADIPKGTSLLTKSFDPTKPTVAIVLGNDQTEITDFLIPYELFSASEAYNVYAVAPERKLTTLSVTPLDLVNILFHWDHPTDGVLLYDGVGELELASIFDTYAATYSAKLQVSLKPDDGSGPDMACRSCLVGILKMFRPSPV